jgi:hypothetical protein
MTSDTSLTQHQQEACQKLSPVGRKYFHMLEFDDNENMLYEVRKHWFGLFLLELTGFFISIVLLVSCIVLASTFDGEPGSSVRVALVGLGVVSSLLGLGFTAILATLYKNNVIYVTNEKVAEVQYKGLFNKSISQLSIGDVQDISVKQTGIPAHIFNYGTLVIETSGEQQNYTFSYVPRPYEASKVIVQAHEDNLKLYGN